jgi:dihydrolipoamide dehydrogenase
MSKSQKCDFVVIGGGTAGLLVANYASRLGAKAVVIEKKLLGGVCVNAGCIPTKALLSSVETLRKAMHANDSGVDIDGGVEPSLEKMVERKDRVVAELVSNVHKSLEINRVPLIRGEAYVLPSRCVKVNDEQFEGKNLVIATGSEATIPPIPGVDLPNVYDTTRILNLKRLPKSMVIIGGNYIGAEFATIFAALGTAVSMLKRKPFLLPGVDEELSILLGKVMAGRGINIIVGADVKGITEQEKELRVAWDTPEGERCAVAEVVLMATGQVPCTGGFGMENLAINMDGEGIAVDEHLETSVKGVYAVGDVTAKMMLAHCAIHQGEVAVQNALGRPRKADYSAVPHCVYTYPEVTGVGMTENETRQKGILYKATKARFNFSGRALTTGETTGMVKLICEEGSGRVLGMHIMGTNASEMISVGSLAVRLKLTAKDVFETVFPHPTMCESIKDAALMQLLQKRSIP